MKVVIASRNPVKIRAVEEAFSIQFPNDRLQTVGCDVASGVSDQPMSDKETRQGARNRAQQACNNHPDADYWVGLEGGLDVFDDQLMAYAWMSIKCADGRSSDARSVTLPLPPAVKVLVDQGLELGDANDRVFSTENSKQKGGAYGLLTDGMYTRESVYNQTLVIALVPFVNALYAD